MTNITGSPVWHSTINGVSDGEDDNAITLNRPLWNLADNVAYLKARGLIACPYVGSSDAYGTTVETITGDSAWHGSSVITTTVSSVPGGSVFIVDAMVVASSNAASTAQLRLEILEGSTVTVDPFMLLPLSSSDTLYHLFGKFTKTGDGDVTIRLGAKGGAGPTVILKSPASLRAQVITPF